MRRKPKLRRRIASPILAGLVLLAVTVAGMPSLTRVPVRSVKIEGTLQQLSGDRIKELVRPFTAWGWVRLPTERLRERLEEEEWVASAEVHREWPLNVRIEIVERRPVARWAEDALIDERAEVFDPGLPINRSLPLLHGPEGAEGEILDRFRRFSALLGANSLAVSELRVDARGAWSLIVRDGPQLRLGAEFLDLRMKRALLALQTLNEEPGAEMAYVDLRYPNGFAVGWRTPNRTSRKRGGVSP